MDAGKSGVRFDEGEGDAALRHRLGNPDTRSAVTCTCRSSPLYGPVRVGDTVYIPGGGDGVWHLAVQMAARVLGAGLVISSGSTRQSMALARQSGAHHVFDYNREVDRRPGRRSFFGATYSEAGFVEPAKTVRRGGNWLVLGVGPGKTTRVVLHEQ